MNNNNDGDIVVDDGVDGDDVCQLPITPLIHWLSNHWNLSIHFHNIPFLFEEIEQQYLQ